MLLLTTLATHSVNFICSACVPCVQGVAQSSSRQPHVEGAELCFCQYLSQRCRFPNHDICATWMTCHTGIPQSQPEGKGSKADVLRMMIRMPLPECSGIFWWNCPLPVSMNCSETAAKTETHIRECMESCARPQDHTWTGFSLSAFCRTSAASAEGARRNPARPSCNCSSRPT